MGLPPQILTKVTVAMPSPMKTPLSQKVIDQACRYNLVLQVPYLCITNGRQQLSCSVDFDSKCLKYIPELPKYRKKC